MLRRRIVVLAACFAVSLSWAADAQPPIPEEVLENARLRVERKYNVGIVIGLVDAGGVTYSAFGLTTPGGEPLDESSVFEIGSITKVFTTATLSRMAERGELSLEDAVADLLPDGVTMPQYGDEPIRLVDLATHRSGFPRQPTNMPMSSQLNPYYDYTVELLYEFLDEVELQRAPGEEAEYSNVAMGLLGHVLTLEAGMEYEAMVKREILDPLGMGSTGIVLTPAMQERLALPHVGWSRVINWDIPALAGAGALRSSAVDMVRFLRANMGLMPTELYPALGATHEPRGNFAPLMAIGLGWVSRLLKTHTIVWHNGGTGGYRAFAGFSPELGLGAVVLTNSQQSADDIGFRLLGATEALFDPAVKERPPLFKKD